MGWWGDFNLNLACILFTEQVKWNTKYNIVIFLALWNCMSAVVFKVSSIVKSTFLPLNANNFFQLSSLNWEYVMWKYFYHPVFAVFIFMNFYEKVETRKRYLLDLYYLHFTSISHTFAMEYSQTWVNDDLRIVTTCRQRPPFWGPICNFYIINALWTMSIMATILGSYGRSL